jgi:hypothetical protein
MKFDDSSGKSNTLLCNLFNRHCAPVHIIIRPIISAFAIYTSFILQWETAALRPLSKPSILSQLSIHTHVYTRKTGISRARQHLHLSLVDPLARNLPHDPGTLEDIIRYM